jgi:hypothetical protein
VKNTKTKRLMSQKQLDELTDMKDLLSHERDVVAECKHAVNESAAEARYVAAALRTERTGLKRAEKSLLETKAALARLVAKYKGWAKPKTS